MQAHGGKVTVSSEKDKFSEFTLYIPKNVWSSYC
jgi:two-component system phosphate regulon sensor histidine kinase PhoR